MNVAVLGGGNGAHATAAELALGGHSIRLWRRDATGLEAVRRAGGITLAAEGKSARAALAAVTADLGEAVGGADVVVVVTPATAHEDVARRLGPHLGERQVVLLTPGTFGAYVMAREIARHRGRLPLAFAE